MRILRHQSLFLLLVASEAWSFSTSSFNSFSKTSKSFAQHGRTTNRVPFPSKRKVALTQNFMANNLIESITSLFPSSNPLPPTTTTNGQEDNPATRFLDALNDGNIDAAMELVSDNDATEWDDCLFYKSCIGTEQIERRLRLQSETVAFQEQQYRIENVAVDNTRYTIGVLFHKETRNDNRRVDNSRGCAMFDVDPVTNLITRVCLVKEPKTRGGEAGLQVLSRASKVMETTGYNPEAINQNQRNMGQQPQQSSKPTTTKSSPPEQYFEAWNRRDMTAAVKVFTENVEYEDTAFPDPFVGKEKLQAHLDKCADALPPNFQIILDKVAVDQRAGSAMVEWHFENDGEALPYTQGSSFYKLDKNRQKIEQGIDFIEPAVIKTAGVALFADSLRAKLSQEPIRWIALVSWIAYMYIVFFSDGILPGANALQLEARTWEEVINLSLNFFLVSPLLDLPFSPSVHPMLEGVFNLLLSWAAMFAGFLSDDRPRKPNLLPMFPIVVGMQFLTSAFLLPYLAVRSSEPSTTTIVAKDELPIVAQVAGESRILPGLMAFVGSGSILWFFLGRAQEYGTEFSVRYASFIDLLSIDRVGSSFLVDLAIFALFQGWLVDDDLKRRGVNHGGLLEQAAKYVPFFGMAAYLLLRPSLPESRDEITDL